MLCNTLVLSLSHLLWNSSLTWCLWCIAIIILYNVVWNTNNQFCFLWDYICLWCNFWVDSCCKIFFSFPFWNMHTICLTKWFTHSWISLSQLHGLCLLDLVAIGHLIFSDVHLGLLLLDHQHHWKFNTSATKTKGSN